MPPENDTNQKEKSSEGPRCSPDEIKLIILNGIHSGLTCDSIITNLGEIGNVSIKFIESQFDVELLKVVKAELKNVMTELVTNGNSQFILEARNEIMLSSAFFNAVTKKLVYNGISLDDERLATWPGDLQKFYFFLESRFVPTGPEESLRNLIVEWFETGEMSLQIWKQWVSWFSNGIFLKTLKDIQWHQNSQKDIVKSKFLKTLPTIPTDDFLEKDGLRKILTLYLEEPKLKIEVDEYVDENGHRNNIETKTINVIGRTIFLSTIKDKLESMMKQKEFEQVDIVAKNAFHIDDSLGGNIWSGKNITIVADKVNVWNEQVFDVSGHGYSPSPGRQARNGGVGENGFNGKDGRAGLSSGNIAIITESMTNSESLTLKLSGGDGEDAESGGNGGDGKDGIGVDLQELKDIAIKYRSLWDTMWSHWTSYSPPGWTKTWGASNFLSSYIWYQFQDVDGRTLHYTYGADKGWLYNWYELVIWIKGTDGTPGGIGGLNGKGGEGGNPGECTVINPTTGWEYSINKICLNGRNGTDGKVGECGQSGYNGNHMALIDRSAKGSNLHYYGSETPRRLTQTWSCENSQYTRINRYFYIEKNDAACYGGFQYGDVPTSGLRQQQQQKKDERSSEAQTTMKKSIVLNKVLQKAQEHKAKMDSAMSAAAVSLKSKTAQKLNFEEDVDEEESTEQEQEVVIVKEVNEEQLDICSSKARKCKLSPLQYLTKVKQKRNYEGACLLAQEIIEYFLIEFNDEDLESIKRTILKKCGRFRNVMENHFQKMIIAAVQAKHPDGLTCYELQALAKQASSKRIIKKENTRFRASVAGFPAYCQTAILKVEEKLVKQGNKLEKVKFVVPENDKFWFHDISKEVTESLVKEFFKDYRFNKVEIDLLLIVFQAYSNLEGKYSSMFVAFEDFSVKWADPESWEGFRKSLTKVDANVEKIIKAIAADKAWFNANFEALSKAINGSSMIDQVKNSIGNELEIRFGSVPKFHQEEDSNLEAAQFLIRFYWQMKALIEFNRRLIVINLIYDGEVTHAKPATLKSYPTLALETLVKRLEIKKLKVEADNCQSAMKLKGFQSVAFRFLVADMKKLNIEIYGNEEYGTVEMLEVWNCGNELVQLYFDEKQFFTISPNLEHRKLIAAREVEKWRPMFEENKIRLESNKLIFSASKDRALFAAYFPSSFSKTVTEWMECYLAANKNDSTLLKMIYERFEIDGNHLAIADFQFLISTIILLQNHFEISADFILNFASALPQKSLVDNFFILRLESQWRKQLTLVKEFLDVLECITNTRLKILLATKLDETVLNDGTITEEILKKLLLMLRHTSTNNSQLEKMTLTEWIAAAEKQKYFDVSDAIKDFGSVGYYIISLKQQGRAEADMLEKFLTTPKKEYHIPEKLIAQICSLISYNEVDLNDEYLRYLDALLTFITQHSGIEPTGKHIFVTNECDQTRMIQSFEHTEAYQKVISEKVRNVDVIANLIKGVHDFDQSTRIQASQRIANIIKNPSNNTAMLLLEKFDYCIKKLRKGISLRDTQKMAIMYAIESDSNLLSQVNTGEGKSYIVAAIAIIRASQYKSVDIITSSPVLAQRDSAEMKDLYEAMNLNIDHNCYEDVEKRKQAYKANVVYGEIGRFQRDYLLHNFYRKNILGDRARTSNCVIVDEVDNMLLDNGNNMLYLSHSVPGMELLEPLFVHLERMIFVPTIKGNKEKAFATETIEAAVLSDLLGRLSSDDIELMANTSESKTKCFAVRTYLIHEKIIDSDGYLLIEKNDFEVIHAKILSVLKHLTTEIHATKIITCLKAIVSRRREIQVPRYLIPFIRRHLKEYIENAKRALFMKPNEAYVVDVDHTQIDSDITPKVTIIDQNTGVDLATSQWSEGLHQCVQIKHGCRVNPISMKAVFVSNVNYLKGYSRINGLSGTLGSYEESRTLVDLYQADLIKVPTFRAKKLYEHVPVITRDENEWLDAIFEEVADQIKADRSVLIICRSIAEVGNIKNGLLHRYFDYEEKDEIEDCYENLIVYQREFDEFDFGDQSQFKIGRLIIATNLAGRGTDIKLCDELKAAGGLHVIVSFLPENSRIEDQAYGRAARCGDPGSGQIIAITEKTDASGKAPSVFDLKIFRDNAEVQRLKSMTDYYNYHTKIEEECLFAFKQHCLEALGNMNDQKKKDNGVPTEQEIIYFALLDEWALWLDSQGKTIKQCAQDRSPQQRAEIIASVKNFLQTHPITPVSRALNWINCPQPLLALGLIRIDEENIPAADKIFDDIITRFPEFSGDACYYKGLISQWSVKRVKNIPKIGNENSAFLKKIAGKIGKTVDDLSQSVLPEIKDAIPQSLCEINDSARIKTEDEFLQALQSFNLRSDRKKELHTVITKLQQSAGPQTIKSSGFQNQADDISNVYDCLATSAYDIIGHPVNFQTFAPNAQTVEDKYKAHVRFSKYLREGYISPRMLSHKVLDSQCEVLKNKYMLSKSKLQKLFQKMITDDSKMVFYGRTVLQEAEIKKACKLPKREEFWGFLESFGCFKTKQEFYVLQTVPTDGKIYELRNIKRISPPADETYQIQLSDYDLNSKIIFNANEVEEAFKSNNEKLEWLEDQEFLVKDATAVVDFEKFKKTLFMPNYDYFVIEDLAEWLEISTDEALWIAQRLVSQGTLKIKEEILSKINTEISKFESVLQKFKPLIDSPELKKIDEISIAVIKSILQLNDTEALETYHELAKHEIIVPYYKIFYFQNIDDVECPYLPECIRSLVEMFLYHKFAYTFAYNALFKSFEAAKDNQKAKKSIMLAWKPHKSLLKDLIRYGFVYDHKIELRDKDYLSKDDQKQIEEIEKKVQPRLMIRNGTLKSTKKFFADEKLDAGMDVQTQAINVMKQVGKIDENNWWIFWLILKIAFAIFMAWSIPGLILMAIDVAVNFNSYFATLLTVIAAVGTMLYFIQSFKAKYITQTGRESGRERYMQLIDFHSNAVKTKEKHKINSKLTNVITSAIASKVKKFYDFGIPNLEDVFEKIDFNRIGPNKFFRLLPKAINDQPHNWRLYTEAIRDQITRLKPEVTARYFEILQFKNGEIDAEKALIECEKLNETFELKMPRITEELLSSTLMKIIEDAFVSIYDSKEDGDDSKEDEIPTEFIEPGTEINIDSDSDSDSESVADNMIEFCERKYSLDELNTLLGNFKRWFLCRVRETNEQEITQQLTKPLFSLFTKYIENANLSNEQPNGFAEYLEENSDTKYSMEQKRKQVQAFQSMPFIVHDLQNIIGKTYAKTPSKELLSKMIYHGHAISANVMADFVQAIYELFKIQIPTLDTLQVVLQNSGRCKVFSYPVRLENPSKISTITLTLSHGYFYICQTDSKKIFKNKSSSDYAGACLFEVIVNNNPEIVEITKQGEEVFRKMLLSHLMSNDDTLETFENSDVVTAAISTVPKVKRDDQDASMVENLRNKAENAKNKVKNFFSHQ